MFYYISYCLVFYNIIRVWKKIYENDKPFRSYLSPGYKHIVKQIRRRNAFRITGNTVQCHNNAVNFLQNFHNRHPISRP